MSNFSKRSNPNHPVVPELEAQWYKLCAIVMHKYELTEIVITPDDIEALISSELANITAYPKGHNITLKLISNTEAEKIVNKEGGR